MNDSSDSFEDELKALRPRVASRELRERIAIQLHGAERGNRWYAPLALAASVAVAATLIWMWSWPGSRSSQPAPDASVGRTPVSPPAVDSSMPTIIAYRHALARSESDLFTLLDSHAAAVHAPESPTRQMPARQAPLRWRDLPTFIDPHHENGT